MGSKGGGHHVAGVHGCACFEPNERWVFVADAGEVYVLGQGDEGDEAPIVKGQRAYFSSVRCIGGGYAYAVGVGRKVYKRTKAHRWEPVHTTAMATKASLQTICCASDGKVYILTDTNALLIGRDDTWVLEQQHVADHLLEEIVCYDGRVFISSPEKIFESSICGDRVSRRGRATTSAQAAGPGSGCARVGPGSPRAPVAADPAAVFRHARRRDPAGTYPMASRASERACSMTAR